MTLEHLVGDLDRRDGGRGHPHGQQPSPRVIAGLIACSPPWRVSNGSASAEPLGQACNGRRRRHVVSHHGFDLEPTLRSSRGSLQRPGSPSRSSCTRSLRSPSPRRPDPVRMCDLISGVVVHPTLKAASRISRSAGSPHRTARLPTAAAVIGRGRGHELARPRTRATDVPIHRPQRSSWRLASRCAAPTTAASGGHGCRAPSDTPSPRSERAIDPQSNRSTLGNPEPPVALERPRAEVGPFAGDPRPRFRKGRGRHPVG